MSEPLDASVAREIECLACGTRRAAGDRAHRSSTECPRCGYVGWSYPESLTGPERELLHRRHHRIQLRPLESRLPEVGPGDAQIVLLAAWRGRRLAPRPPFRTS